MKLNRYFIYFMAAFFWGGLVVGCKPRIDTMSKAEKIFIKKVDKTAGKLDLNEDQKMKLEGLKAEIRKNFQEGLKRKKGSLGKNQGGSSERKSRHPKDDLSPPGNASG